MLSSVAWSVTSAAWSVASWVLSAASCDWSEASCCVAWLTERASDFLSCAAVCSSCASVSFAVLTDCSACDALTLSCARFCGVSPASVCASWAFAERRFACAVRTVSRAEVGSTRPRTWPLATCRPGLTFTETSWPPDLKLTPIESGDCTVPLAETDDVTTPLAAVAVRIAAVGAAAGPTAT